LKFEELGLIKKSIIVVLKITYNSEQYILLETKNCRQLTFDRFPLRVQNTKDWLTLSNLGTNKASQIQILEYNNGFFIIKNTVTFPKEFFPKRILKIEKNEVFIVDVENKIWKIIV
jgi:hypothetical protein